LEDTDLRAPDTSTDDEMARMREDCLNSCLQDLEPEKKELILSYYARDKQAKIDHRSEMARKLGISVETLRVRVHRLRVTIETCIERCLNRMDQKK
jgi:RNA polymerase sigma factor (sigma-70 family)